MTDFHTIQISKQYQEPINNRGKRKQKYTGCESNSITHC
jgi:hypothetical protein